MPPASSNQKPWPMKWIVLTIVVVLTAYTYITLHFRKPGAAYRPYQDTKDRVTVSRLLSAGYQRINATLELPAEAHRPRVALGTSGTAIVKDAPGGLPEELETTLIEKPNLPESFGEVNTPAEANFSFPYSVEFVARASDEKQALAQTYVYLKGNELAIVADFERLRGELLSRTKETIVLLTIPSGTLQPGTYHVVLVGSARSKQWTLQVH